MDVYTVFHSDESQGIPAIAAAALRAYSENKNSPDLHSIPDIVSSISTMDWAGTYKIIKLRNVRDLGTNIWWDKLSGPEEDSPEPRSTSPVEGLGCSPSTPQTGKGIRKSAGK